MAGFDWHFSRIGIPRIRIIILPLVSTIHWQTPWKENCVTSAASLFVPVLLLVFESALPFIFVTFIFVTFILVTFIFVTFIHQHLLQFFLWCLYQRGHLPMSRPSRLRWVTIKHLGFGGFHGCVVLVHSNLFFC